MTALILGKRSWDHQPWSRLEAYFWISRDGPIKLCLSCGVPDLTQLSHDDNGVLDIDWKGVLVIFFQGQNLSYSSFFISLESKYEPFS